MEEKETHLSRTQARAGSINHVTRYVLSISLLLVIVLFVLIVYLWR